MFLKEFEKLWGSRCRAFENFKDSALVFRFWNNLEKSGSSGYLVFEKVWKTWPDRTPWFFIFERIWKNFETLNALFSKVLKIFGCLSLLSWKELELWMLCFSKIWKNLWPLGILFLKEFEKILSVWGCFWDNA